MSLELVTIETDTYPLYGLYYEPDGGAVNGAVLIMHGNSSNFYTGVPRAIAPILTKLGYAALAYNRRGHDILISQNRVPSGGATQRVHEMIADNKFAEEWLSARGFKQQIVIGHSNGGMLAVRHCADNPNVRALVLLSAHMGGKDLFKTISAAGLMAGDRYDEFSARARSLVAAGKGDEMMLVPGWWWVISANTFVDYLDLCPDILALAPQVTCPTLFLRGDKEPVKLYPGEDFVARCGGPAEFQLVSDCDHFYTGREATAMEQVAAWLKALNLATAA
jgi:pimeloyl-ACP methyl ester carboxylesterase